MRLDGDHMVIGMKDIRKLIGVFILSFCAVFVCTLFINYNMDLSGAKEEILAGPGSVLFDALILTGKMISAVSGGCLLLTTAVMLCFYIRHYIDVHKKELGILKALGYSNLRIAKGFYVFGFAVFAGTAAGFASSFLMMPQFYRIQNSDRLLPDIPVNFHGSLFLCFVVLPTLVFALLAIVYSYRKLKRPVTELLKGKQPAGPKRTRRMRQPRREMTFLQELKRSTVRSRASLLFFIAFACFCYGSMLQMTMSLDELASPMMAAMILIIGIILACTTLLLAVSTVVNANTKTIAMMRVFGYSFRDCTDAVLNGYRPVAYLGFAVGTIYQYILIKLMVTVVFGEMETVPDYVFNRKAFVVVLISFVIVYEAVMRCYSARIRKVSVKEIMLE